MRKRVQYTVLLAAACAALCLAQTSSPFAVLPPVAPVAGVSGGQLAWDTTNKVLVLQTMVSGVAPTTILSMNPHILDSGGSFSITVSVSGTNIAFNMSTSAGALVYRISNGTVSQDKFCSTTSPLPTGAVACPTIPF